MILKNFYREKRKIRSLSLYIVLIIFIMVDMSSFDITSSRWSKPIPITVLNSKADDYAPNYNIYDNLLYFSSSRIGSTNFYVAKLNNGSFENPMILKSQINQTAKNQNYISFFSKELAYFTSFKSTDNYPVLNIFKSYYVKNSWTIGILDDTLNLGESNAQLTISPDKTTAIFVSNRNNKKEDTDLWMIQKNEDGEWTTPVKLDEINTQSREITPFLKSSDTLFFASDGFGGPGGFDLFVSIKINGVWQRPTPLFDLNTEFNESDVSILPDNSLIFSSDRPGGAGGFDLYVTNQESREFEKQDYEKPDLTILTQTNVIQAERIINSRIYHFPTSIPTKIVSMDKNSNFYQYTIQAFKLLSERLKNNPTSFIQINNSPINSYLENYFEFYEIPKDKYKFVDTNDKYLTFKSNNNELFDFIELSQMQVRLKPPALDINIINRNSESIDDMSIYLRIGNSISEIDVHNNALPLRFIYDIEPFENIIFNADSISIVAKYNFSNYQDSVSKVLQVKKSETKSTFVLENDSKVIDFILYLPTQNDVSNFAIIHKNFVKQILDEIDISKRVILFYYNKESLDIAKKIITNIIKGKKYIETNLVPIDNQIISEESKNFFKLRIEKY